MAPSLKDITVGQIEARLRELQESSESEIRTSVLTHVAWVPPEWKAAAEDVLEGLGPRNPSRTILLQPDPAAGADRLDAELEWECFPFPEREVCAETIRLWLRGRTARAPASVVVPLLIPDLPVFLRWRGQPPFRAAELEQLVGVADRLVVDSVEWRAVRRAYTRLTDLFDRVVVSDLAWARTLAWRARLAELWPGIRKIRRLSVVGPEPDALLLKGWLRSRLRLRRRLELLHEPAAALTCIEVDGAAVEPPAGGVPSPSELLSDQLDVLERDFVYEAAVLAV